MNNECIEQVQEQIDYQFDEPKLLRQAFTRRSYAQEHPGTQDNEVLEFYGDKALEFIVMKKLSYYYGSDTNNGKYCSEKNEGQLTEIKKALVGRKMLSARIDTLGFAEYLIMGKGDKAKNVGSDESVKEDLFEAIVGAVAIDSDWNAKAIENVVDLMLDIEYYLENGFQGKNNYVDLIQQWYQKKYGVLPQYEFSNKYDGYYCTLQIPNEKSSFYYRYSSYRGEGESKREARADAAEKAYYDLEKKGELFLPIDEIGEPDKSRAINQLQELFQKGYIGEPTYRFIEEHDDNGNPVWRCECHVEGEDSYWWGNYPSKKEGKKETAYDMLCYVLKRENKR